MGKIKVESSSKIPLCPKCEKKLVLIKETKAKLTNEKNIEMLSCGECGVFLGFINQYTSIV